jgi:hypothetical protein
MRVLKDSIVRRVMPLTVAHAVRLWDWVAEVERLETLTNHQLADLVEDHLWADLPVMTPTSDLLSLVIDRLRQAEESGG